MSDDLVFLPEDDGNPQVPAALNKVAPWKVLVIDDDDGVHSSTRFALERVLIDGRPLELIDLYSAEEARAYLLAHQDVALALVDVVMESDHAGLDFVKWVREEKKDRAIRLVLRTGQPGQAPERHVVVNYDIDDYKTKSELTAQKLFTLLHSSLRSYGHIRALERNLRGLEMIVNSAAQLCCAKSVSEFASGVLAQVTALLNLNDDALLCQTQGIAACAESANLSIVAASGDYTSALGQDPYRLLPSEVQALLAEALAARSTLFRGAHCVAYSEGRDDQAALIYFQATRDIRDEERELVVLFAKNIGAAFCNWSRCGAHVCPNCGDKTLSEERA